MFKKIQILQHWEIVEHTNNKRQNVFKDDMWPWLSIFLSKKQQIIA